MAIETTTKENDNILHPLDTSLKLDFINEDIISRYLAMHPDPYSLFLNAIESPETREKYDRRLLKFFDFLKMVVL